MSDNYYNIVVGKLLKHREYKQRVKKLEFEITNKAEPSSISYDQVRTSKTNNIFDSTFEAVIDRLESDQAKEFREKFEVVNDIEIALAGLTDEEKFIIKKKYLTGRKVDDVVIYTHPNFNFGRTKYYEFKDSAVKRIARILGIISEKK